MNITDNRTRWLALIVLCLGDLMIVLDTTIVNVALPSIREDLGFTETSLAWVVNAYLLTFGGFLLLGGRLGDLFGHRRLFLAGITLFTGASVVCGLSTTQGMLVAARAVQGVGGAVVSAVALSLIMNLFTEPGERAKAMGVFGFVMAGGGSIGVLLGGVLTDTLSWHWIFLVNVPIGIVVYFLTLRLLPSSQAATTRGRLDIAGAVTVTASLMLAVYAIVNGNDNGWLSAETLGLLAAAAVLMAGFFVLEIRVAEPLVPLAILKLRNIWASNLVGMLWAASMFAWFFLSALYMQLVLGYSPLQVGLSFLPANVIMGVFSVGLSARLVMRFGIKPPLVTGLGIASVGLLLFTMRARRRHLHGRRAPEHDPARLRRRHGVQPDAARGDERRGAGGVRAGVRRGQHRVHDGRRARARRAREPRRLAHRQPDRLGLERGRGAHRRLPPRLRRRHDLRRVGRRPGRSAAAHRRGTRTRGGRRARTGRGDRLIRVGSSRERVAGHGVLLEREAEAAALGRLLDRAVKGRGVFAALEDRAGAVRDDEDGRAAGRAELADALGAAASL